VASASPQVESQQLMGGRVTRAVFASEARRRVLLALALAVACAGGTYAGQDGSRHKVPAVLEKLNSGPSQQAFSGVVESLDLHHSLLNVNPVEGNTTEIFPIKKTQRVAAADGSRLALQTLKPGTNVLIYYEQKGDRRTVKDIVVLRTAPRKPAPPAKESKPAPPS